jgi:hypothetical protein
MGDWGSIFMQPPDGDVTIDIKSKGAKQTEFTITKFTKK